MLVGLISPNSYFFSRLTEQNDDVNDHRIDSFAGTWSAESQPLEDESMRLTE